MMSLALPQGAAFSIPLPLDAYPPASPDGLLATLTERAHIAPFNPVATAVFLLAILHTFLAPRFMALAHRIEKRHGEYGRTGHLPPVPSIRAEILHFFGEVEVVF